MGENKAHTEAVLKRTQDWLAYINAEVVAVCGKSGWSHQIRRKWSVREKPVARSPVDDYEWKLMPGSEAETWEASPAEFDEGTYFVLGFDSANGEFILQHDTHHCGVMGDHWFTCTYTRIHLAAAMAADEHYARIAGGIDEPQHNDLSAYIDRLPPTGLLQRFLLALTARFQPNEFSIT